MSKQINPYPLRIDETVFEKIRFIAIEDGRSINKEIEFILKKYVDEFESGNGEIIICDNVVKDK